MNLSRLTIRARITGGSILIAVLISIAAGVIIYNQVERIVRNDQVRVLQSIEGPYLTAINDGDTEEFDPPGPGQFAAVVAPDSTVAINTLPDSFADQIPDLASGADGTRVTSSGGDAYVVRVTSVSAAGAEWRVITATGHDDQVLDEVALLLIVSVSLITLGFGAAAWLIGSAALSPVARLRRSAAELVSSPSTEMLPVGPANDEISALAETLNELISELRASADRERQIVSDASHEFRTPLAIIQTRLELAQKEATTLTDMQKDVSAAQKTLGRLSALATSMLELSRIDAQTEPGRSTFTELSTELAEAADRGRRRVDGRDIRIDYSATTESTSDVVAVSDVDFGRVCDNLVNNALAAISGQGVIDLRLARESTCVRLSVSDDAGGMDEQYVPHAFDRFSTQHGARNTGGAGLGLAIVAGIATTAGGTVSLNNTPGVGLQVDVTFPFATPHQKEF